MNRITKQNVEARINYLNELVGANPKVWTENAEGKLKANIGTYYWSGSMTGHRLHLVCNENGGVHSITYGKTKRDFYDAINNIIEGIRIGLSIEK